MSDNENRKKSFDLLAKQKNLLQNRNPKRSKRSRIARKRGKHSSRRNNGKPIKHVSTKVMKSARQSRKMNCVLNQAYNIAVQTLRNAEDLGKAAFNSSKIREHANIGDVCVVAEMQTKNFDIKTEPNVANTMRSTTMALQPTAFNNDLKLTEISPLLAKQIPEKISKMLADFNFLVERSEELLCKGAKIILNVDDVSFPKVYKAFRNFIADKLNIYMGNNLAIPIYHCILKQDKEIHILCKNQYAFNCLNDWSKHAKLTSKLFENLELQLLTPTMLGAFYYEVISEDVVTDVSHFLMQLEKHLLGLHSKHWILIRQDVCYINEQTRLHFIIDGLSSMVLTNAYGSNITVFLRNIIFKRMYRIPC